MRAGGLGGALLGAVAGLGLTLGVGGCATTSEGGLEVQPALLNAPKPVCVSAITGAVQGLVGAPSLHLRPTIYTESSVLVLSNLTPVTSLLADMNPREEAFTRRVGLFAYGDRCFVQELSERGRAFGPEVSLKPCVCEPQQGTQEGALEG